MKFLLKYPTRQRPEQFLSTLQLFYEYCNHPENVQVIVSIDEDDVSMQDEQIQYHTLSLFPNTQIYSNAPRGKIAACNANLDMMDKDIDIILLVSDDMIPQCQGWDSILIAEMKQYYPDLDGVLFHNDGYVGRQLNMMCILGIKYFKRFNYLYHPDYISLYCDNEFMDVANQLKRQKYFDLCLFKHEHYARNSAIEQDELMKHNESFYGIDKKTYDLRRRYRFPLKSVLKK